MSYMFFCATNFRDAGIRKWIVRSDTNTGSYVFWSNDFTLRHSFVLVVLMDRRANVTPNLLIQTFNSARALTQCFVESSDGNCKCATTACGGSGVPISQWNTSGILYMQNAFKDKTTFNQDLSAWDTRSTINMYSMFENAAAFNQNIGAWDVTQVTDLKDMFNGASSNSTTTMSHMGAYRRARSRRICLMTQTASR